MSDIAKDFSHIDDMDVPTLYVRYEELKNGLRLLPDGRPDPTAIEDDRKLEEMCRILGALRRKSAGPPKTGARSARAPKAPASEPDISVL